MKLSIEIEQCEVESMAKVATTVVESILKGRTEITKLAVESVDRTVGALCSRIDKWVELELARVAEKKAEFELEWKREEAEAAKEEIDKRIDEKIAGTVKESLKFGTDYLKSSTRKRRQDSDE